MYSNDKVTVWNMRCSKKDAAIISNLAKRMKVKESEAVRIAIREKLERLTKRGVDFAFCSHCGGALDERGHCQNVNLSESKSG